MWFKVGVATGEVAQNKIIFKQLLQEDAIEFCQIDSCRIAGPSEIFSVLLMAAVKNIKVCPHAGGVGLCEYVRHLSMIDYVCFSGSLEGRVCESTTHLHEFFDDAVDFKAMPDNTIRSVDNKFWVGFCCVGWADILLFPRDVLCWPKKIHCSEECWFRNVPAVGAGRMGVPARKVVGRSVQVW